MTQDIQTAPTSPLPALVRQAAHRLATAETAAQVLEAREMAGLAYDTAARAARLARAQKAHRDVIAACHHAKADALEIEAAAQRRIAEEYDAAQERGEVARAGDNQHNREALPNGKDLGLSHKQIHEARMIRDIETADPGAIGRAAHAMAEEGREPTRAAVRRTAARRVEPSGLVDSRGRRMPQRPLPGCMDRGLRQLADTIEVLDLLFSRPDCAGHERLGEWVDGLARCRTDLSRLINRERRGDQ